jgi:outer membrane protein assembly factor BamD (BamD/ComL family)
VGEHYAAAQKALAAKDVAAAESEYKAVTSELPTILPETL